MLRLAPGISTLGLLLLVAGPAHAADDPTSAGFRLERATQSSAGAAGESARFRVEGSFGQETTIGASASPRFVLQSGFWSFLGSGVVPVVLTVERNPVTPDHVDLSWSGNNAPYDVFRSSDCKAVFGGFFGSTSALSLENVALPPENLICINVLQTAPGPKGAP